jgi:uncharacterized protein (TIGR01777 family)
MKILLTGATGLIGREVGKQLSESGIEVISLSRDASRARRSLPFLTEVHEWAGGDAPFSKDLIALFQNVDGVVNLMGENISEHRWSAEFKEKLSKSRVSGTKSLVDALRENSKLRVWVQGSAIGFYGSSKDESNFDESSAMGSGFLAELSRDWESALKGLSDSVRLVTLRIGVVFSHQGGAYPKLLTPLLQGVGGILGSGVQKMSIVHLTDVARFIPYAIHNDQVRGVYNLVAGMPVTNRDLMKKLSKLLSIRLAPRAPAFALKLAIGEMAETLLESQGVVSRRIPDTGFLFKYPDVDTILQEVTQWNLHPFKAGQAVFIQYTEQFVPRELESIFPFFSEARNLETITPEWLNFKIQRVSTPSIEKGTKIRYRLKLHGVPLKWITDIAEWEPPLRFVDNQIRGPYSLWYHEHSFEAVRGGTLLRDWVRFQLPMGKIGQWFGLGKVRSDVSRIFEHRRVKIQEIFGS